MATRPPHLVVIGASAGGLQALTAIVERLSPTFNACVLVVVHTSSSGDGGLPAILDRASVLSATFAQDHDVPCPGHIYVAPADFHLLVTDRELRVLHGPRENGFRPAIDPLFRTAARVWKSRVIGVILSGALDDGTNGLSVIKRFGGTAIVQDPAEATIPSMPRSAVENVDVDYVLPAAEIGPMLERLTAEETVEGRKVMARSRELEPQLPSQATEVADMQRMYGAASALTCPDCGGALWEIEEGRVMRYQCHTGHRFSPDSLDAEQREAVDSALWSAVRVLEEHAELKLRLARQVAAGGLSAVSAGFAQGARDAQQQAQEIRTLLFRQGNGGEAITSDAAMDEARVVPSPRRGREKRRSAAASASGRPSRRATAAARRKR